VTRKSITTSHAAVACDVCGRTLLRGEEPEVFLVGAERRMVCDLCIVRAAHEGWVREGADIDAASRRENGRKRRSLFGRLRARRDNGHDKLAPRGGERLVETWEAELPPAQPTVSSRPPARVHEPAFEPPREQRHVHAVPTNAELKMARAVELFNASEHPRTVAGVARSLGAPLVSVRPSPTEGSVVSITIAWELSWYRFEVDLADESSGVRIIAQGTELDELEPADRTANASADEAGALALGA
jgi:hypothetical protein